MIPMTNMKKLTALFLVLALLSGIAPAFGEEPVAAKALGAGITADAALALVSKLAKSIVQTAASSAAVAKALSSVS